MLKETLPLFGIPVCIFDLDIDDAYQKKIQKIITNLDYRMIQDGKGFISDDLYLFKDKTFSKLNKQILESLNFFNEKIMQYKKNVKSISSVNYDHDSATEEATTSQTNESISYVAIEWSGFWHFLNDQRKKYEHDRRNNMTEKEYMLTARKIFDSVDRYGSGILDTDDFCMALRFDKNIHSLFKPSLMNGIGADVKMGNG